MCVAIIHIPDGFVSLDWLAEKMAVSESPGLLFSPVFSKQSAPYEAHEAVANAQVDEPEDGEALRSAHESQRHPLGLKPSGNALTSAVNLQSSTGAFSRVPDSTILLLLEYLDERDLVKLGSTCKAMFAFSTYDQLWRDITVGDMRPNFQWRGSWRASRRRLPSSRLPRIDCSHLFADALYRPFQCSQVPFEPYVTGIPETNQITRLTNLSLTEFNQSWANEPIILTQPVREWRVFKDWDEDFLLKRYADTTFRAEAVDWPLHTYMDYMNDTEDESPLYLFDRAFAEKMDLMVGQSGAYNPPECFKEDLFMLLGSKRPDHRWLIVGPKRSGSTFHKDPNATSAWNAVIRGSKYWIMFPNSVVPPGVYMSEDQSEVTSPLSIAEWLLTFHDEARNTPGCIEGICHEGEVLHVPSGWWHLVVNLEPAIAITQNFVPRSHVRAAANFLKNKPDQISGFQDDVQDPYALFMEKLEQAHPDLFVSLQQAPERKRKWEEVVAEQSNDDNERGGFSFGFGLGDNVEDDTDDGMS